MKIAIIGSAPSSIGKAPFGDPSWKIWACSPGTYASLARVDEFWEVHRWEPGVIGRGATQKPWFTPEYVAWLKSVPPVLWVADPDALAECPNARELPWRQLVDRYGHYVWTSSVAYMAAQAIDRIVEHRGKLDAIDEARRSAGLPIEAREPDAIGFFGIDMAANEELYSGQRAACQFFIQVLVGLKIGFVIPPESDLAVPPPMYGVSETNHRAIKFLEREREIEGRLAAARGQADGLGKHIAFLEGALDDLKYHRTMWLHEGDSLSFDFEKVFPEIAAGREAARAAAAPPPAVDAPKVSPVDAEVVMTAADREKVAAARGTPIPKRRARKRGKR